MEVDVTLDKPWSGSAPTAATSSEPERLVTVENDLVRMVMTTRGARIKELLLKKYAAPWKSPPNLVWRWDYLCGGASTPATGRGGNDARVNLVEVGAALWPAVEIAAMDNRQCCDGAPACTPTWSLTAVMPARCPLSMASAGSPRRRLVSRRWSAQVSTMDGSPEQILRHRRDSAHEHDVERFARGTNALEYAVALRWPLPATSTATISPCMLALRNCADSPHSTPTANRSRSWCLQLWLGPILRPDIWLLRPLQWLYGVTHNYGVAIIIITVIIKLLYPLSWKSFKSMQAMQHLQPQMKRLQDMYKNDRQKLNEEMMKLYREQKVNPLGGCLPMVVQIPVFISLVPGSICLD